MEKKLTTKVQKIIPKLPEYSQNISKALIIEPDDETTLEKKGTIYAIFDISGKRGLDVLLVTKIVNDVLHDAYFQSESVSPIQSIEKAILKLRDNIAQIAKEETETELTASFNINTVILWGNTLYIVQYGNTHAYLMREASVKPINSASEGNFSVASGVIKDNDVVILATEDFARKYPPEKLIGTSELQLETLEPLEACLIMKFNVVKEFSKEEVVDFGSSFAETSAPAVEKPSRKRFKNNINNPLKKFKEAFKKEPKQTATIRDIRPPEEGNKKLVPIVVLFASLAIIALGAAFFKSGDKILSSLSLSNTPEIQETEQLLNEVNTPEVEAVEEVSEEQDRVNRVKRIDPEVFYDLKLTNENVKTAKIIFLSELLVVSDEAAAKLYTSSVTTPKFTELESELAEVNNLINHQETIGFTDVTGLKAIDPETNQIVTTYSAEGLGVTTTYLDFIYSIIDDTIQRYSTESTFLEGVLWTQNEQLSGAKSLAVNVSIYALSKDDKVLKFTTGEMEEFAITGLDKPLNNAVEIISKPDLEGIYIADAGNKRIVVINEEGALLRQYRPNNTEIWADIKDMTISEDETKIFVLDGTKVYEFEIEENDLVVDTEESDETLENATEGAENATETEAPSGI